MKNPDEIRAYYNKLLDQCSLEMRMLPWITRFLDRVYFGPLMNKIDQSMSRYMSGTFGETELMSGVLAGRIMFTFKSGNKSFSIVGIEGSTDDTFGLTSAFECLTYKDAIEMIRDVINHWDIDKICDSNTVGLHTPVGDFQ